MYNEASMKQPEVSVIVTTYNLEKYLKQCLDSIKNQSYQHFECIIVDDGSTDKTLNIIDRYVKQDKRFSLIKKSHGGVSTARNAGFDAAKSAYIIYLDGDDFFSPNLLDKLHRKAISSDADITVCNYSLYFDSMQKTGDAKLDLASLSKKSFSYSSQPDDLFNAYTLMFWNKLFKREFLSKHGFRNDESLRRAQDIEFVGKCLAAAEKIACVNEPLVSYRTDMGSSNVKRLAERPYDVISALGKLKQYLEENDKYSVVKKSYTKIAVDHVLASLYFMETDPVHHKVFEKTKEFFAEKNDIVVKDATFATSEKSYREIKALLSGSYEDWLRLRITDLRDDKEAKYISYLLNEFQRKYKEETDKTHLLQRQNDLLLNSLSWKITKPLRGLRKAKGRVLRRG